MRAALPLALALALAVPAEAQRSDQEIEDAGFLEGLLEGALSDGTRDVNVIGFEGALSSRAEIERIEIADGEGVWLTVEGAVLDWNRSALLRGRLDVEELSADRIVLDRLPVSDGVPEPTAGGGLGIPELPVSIDVERLAIDRLLVGEAVAGVEAEISAVASASLDGQSLNLDFVAERLDAEARFAVLLAFDPESGQLEVDVEASEGEGGLVASALDLPGRPSVELRIDGSGPIEDFAADIALQTDGAERLGGTAELIALQEEDEATARRFRLDLSGDITPLFAPDYREFFGEDLRLRLDGVRTAEGRTVLDALTLSSAALRIDGSAAVAADNLPERFDLRVLLGDPAGPTRLPVGGRVLVDSLDLSATFDAADGDAWTLSGRLDGLDTTEFDVDAVVLDGGGTIDRNGANAVTARVEAALSGFAARDPDLQRALGDEVSAVVDVDWRAGEPTTVNLLTLEGDDYGIEARGVATTADGPAMDGRIGFYFNDLSRVAGLAGLPLEGGINGRLEGRAATDGSFDAAITGLGQNLKVGIGPVDALLGGRAEIALDAARDEAGTIIREARIGTEALDLSAEGARGAETAELRLDLTVDDVARLGGPLEGPVGLTGEATLADERWRLIADVTAPAGTEAQVLAVLPLEGFGAVDFDARVARLEELVPQLPGALVLSGRAEQSEAGWTASLDADAPEGITAEVEAELPAGGPVTAGFEAVVPETGAFTDAVSGRAVLTGDLTQSEAGTRVTLDLDGPEGITAQIAARLAEDEPITVGYEARLPDLGVFVPQLPGAANVSGVATQSEGGWRTNLSLGAPAGISARGVATLGAEGDVTAQLRGTVAEPGVLREGLPGPIDFEADVTRAADGALDAEVDATTPGGDAVRLDFDGDPAADFEAAFEVTLDDPSPYLNGLEGPVTAEGTAARRDGVLSADVDAAAGDGSTASVTASVPPEGDASVRATADIADLSPFVPELPGPATLDARGSRGADGVWDVDLDLEAGRGTRVAASGTVAEDLSTADMVLDARTEALEAVLPQLPGAATITGRVARDGEVFDLDVEGTAPRGTRFDVAGQIAQDLSVADLEVDAETGALSAFVPQIGEGRASIGGTVERQGERIALDVEGTAPRGTVFDIAGTVSPDLADMDVEVDARGGILGAFVPQLEGESSVRGRIGRADGVFDLDVAGTAPGATSFDVDGRIAPDLSVADVDFDVSTGLVGRFVPQLAGGARASGSVRSAGPDRLAVDVSASGPAGLSASAAGTISPDLAFADLDVDARLGNLGAFVPRLPGAASVDGRLGRDGGRWQVAADVTAAGVTARVDGSAAEDFSDLALSASGRAPLELANPFIQPRSLAGTAAFDIEVDGPPALSSVRGTITTDGSRLALPRLRQAIGDLGGRVELTGGAARVALSGSPASGGRLTIEGPIALSPPFDANLTITADELSVRDPLLYETTVSGTIDVTGPLVGGGGAITGRLALGETEVRIPSTGFGGTGAIPAITHVRDTAPVEITRRRARLIEPPGETGRDGTPSRNVFSLDLLIEAERRIFVRGRGLDAELGGAIRLTGDTRNVIPVGQFELIRGRLDLLGRRLTLDEGSIQLQGDFVPVVRLVARTAVDGGTISIVVEGDLTEPEISFESSQGLPEDEVVAQLIFGRGVQNLSALQAARLANAVATLTGRGGTGFVDRIREGAGLDDLDITSDDDGNVGVRAGRYVSENVYTDVTVGSDGEAEVTINIDLTDELTVRGSVDNEGGTGIGLFFERDY
ncbi:MAG: translocation/assembly module TamB domain-containing protein [Hasllibacter sp.]